MKLIKFAIERPVTTTMLFIALAFFGVMAYMNVGVNMMPKVNSPSIMVTTVLPGATPEELEKSVTEKIEKEVSGLSNLKRVISYSMENVSTVQAEFRASKNENEAMNEVKEKVELAMAEMPQSIERPLIQKTNIADIPVLTIVMSGNKSGKELYDLADNKLRNLFTRINGVTKVNIIGGEKREIKILADMRRAAELGLDLTQAGEAIRAANTKLPGGTYDYDGMNFSIETGLEVSSPQAISELMISHKGYPLSVREFATVSDSIERPKNKSTFHDLKNDLYYSNVVTLNILKEPNANEVKLARAIKEKLPEFEKELPEGVSLSIPYDNSAYTESAVDDALLNVILGIILTGAILYLFIGDYRTVIIVSISIPISLIASFIVLKQLNATLNMMTLMSFAVSIGALISNSIVVIENIIRLKKEGMPIKQAAIEGTSEVTMAVIASTGTNLVVFLPMAMMSSMIGVYFVEYALTISVATVFSLLVSFTLTPMLASVLLKKDLKITKFNRFLDRIFESLSERYGHSLEKLLAKKRRGIILFVSMMAIFIASFGLFKFIDFDFMPKEDMSRVFLEAELPAGYSLQNSSESAKQLEKLMMQYPEVEAIQTVIGEKGIMPKGPNLLKIIAHLSPAAERERSNVQLAEMLKKQLDSIPSVKALVSANGIESGLPISFMLQSENPEDLKATADKVVAALQDMEEISGYEANNRNGNRLIRVIPRQEIVSRLNLTVFDVATAINSAINGIKVGVYKEKGKEYDIRISYNEDDIRDISRIKNIPVLVNGEHYTVERLADISYDISQAQIYHVNKHPTVEFGIMPKDNVSDMEMQGKITRLMDELQPSRSVTVKWAGMAEDMDESLREMSFTLILSILLLYMLIASLLENFWHPFLLLTTLPMAMIGVLVLVFLSGTSMNMLSLIAIITLLGLAVNDSILIYDYNRQLLDRGESLHQATVQSAKTKLKTVIMTSVAIAVGTLPNALEFGGGAGAAFRTPMALVTIGGIITSTILTLYVVPSLFYMVKKRKY
ncbi:efflux RND transporter permease subunit [Parabacteroides pacaensis]|uniref:efflux RND transporter permease subunit n=1 Tax=Parabacteroides pacaensis TaxID=2086575 RepID=UPI000D0F4012|nr:efflux RND transporter permease subunit [Parabacteroides pacaensis]